jgi:hypothetical protein
MNTSVHVDPTSPAATTGGSAVQKLQWDRFVPPRRVTLKKKPGRGATTGRGIPAYRPACVTNLVLR